MIVLGEGVGVFLQDLDTVPPVMADTVQEQAISGVGGTRKAEEGTGALLS